MSIPLKNSYKFTVFTPAYNRAHTLARVYQSLVAQTYRDFEWILIDDGSSDNTSELVESWRRQADFSIVYVYQENSGKHAAFNRGVRMANGELFLNIDSDDGFLPNALEIMLHWWEAIPEASRDDFTGIVCLCQFEDGSISGQPFPVSPLDTNALDLRFKYKARGESWGFHRTKILREFPFPEDGTVRFVPENIVWDAIARKFKIRCINEPLRIFYQDSGNQVTKANPRKKALVKKYFLQLLNRDFDYFRYDPETFFKWAVLYIRYSLHQKDCGCMNPGRFRHMGAFFLACLAIFPGIAIYAKDVAMSVRSK